MLGSFTGITLLSTEKGDVNLSQVNNLAFGVILCLMCAITYALVIVLSRKLKEIHYSIMIFWYSSIASLSFGILILINQIQ